MATPALGTQVVCRYTCYYLHMYMAKYDNLNVCVLGYLRIYTVFTITHTIVHTSPIYIHQNLYMINSYYLHIYITKYDN